MLLVYLYIFLLVCICILMYVKRHEQFEIGCGAILNKIYYYYDIPQDINIHVERPSTIYV